MKLQILVSTIDQGINNAAQLVLPPHDDIAYLISWQHSDNTPITLPQELTRDDVTVVDLPGRGLSRNRNNCLRHATGELLLIADDDCRYTHERLQSIITTMDEHPEVDFAAFREDNTETTNVYPNYSFNLNKYPKNYHVASIDIVLRRDKIQGKLWFNELFGYGAPLSCGEEEILLLDAVKMGMNCRYFPIDIVKHVGITGIVQNIGRKDILMGRGAYMFIAKPLTFLPRLFLNSYRLKKKYNVPFTHAVSCMFSGIFYYLKHRNDKQSYS